MGFLGSLCFTSWPWLRSRFSFILTLQGNDLGRIESLLALLSLSAFGGNLSVKCDFLLGL